MNKILWLIAILIFVFAVWNIVPHEDHAPTDDEKFVMSISSAFEPPNVSENELEFESVYKDYNDNYYVIVTVARSRHVYIGKHELKWVGGMNTPSACIFVDDNDIIFINKQSRNQAQIRWFTSSLDEEAEIFKVERKPEHNFEWQVIDKKTLRLTEQS